MRTITTVMEPRENLASDIAERSAQILRKLNLPVDATADHVRETLRDPERLNSLSDEDTRILTAHYYQDGSLIDDECELGSKLDGLSSDKRSAVNTTLADIERRALTVYKQARDAANPEGTRKKQRLITLLRAHGNDARSNPDDISQRPQGLRRRGPLSREEIRQRLLDNVRQL